MKKRETHAVGQLSRRSFLKWAGGMGLALPLTGFPFANLRKANAAEERTLTVAWDTEIDTLDPASFKTIGGYTTIANVYDTPIYWGVSPIPNKGRAFFYPNRMILLPVWQSPGPEKRMGPQLSSRFGKG